MKNARQIWEETSKRLYKVHEKREAEAIAFILLEDQFQIFKADILVGQKKEINQDKLEALVQRLLVGEPLQYVTGSTEFYGRKFFTQEGVLIPRPETEELVALILDENHKSGHKVLDIGVGSGCIAISLALETKGKVYGSDISSNALQLAKQNADHLSAEVELIAHDILTTEIPLDDLDIIVSNPPYIPNQDKQMMHANVLDHEPEQALFVPDDKPLLFYEAVARRSKGKLREEGKLYFEVHERYGNEVQSLLEEIGYSNVCIHQDMQGKNRMISATNSTNRSL